MRSDRPFRPSTPRARLADTSPPRSRRTVVATRPLPTSGYDRKRDLPRLLLLWPEEIADDSAAARAHIIRRLRRALRQERQRGLAGHWTYDLARHASLLRAYRHEVERHIGVPAPTAAIPKPMASQKSVSLAQRAMAGCGSLSPDRAACRAPSSWRAGSAPPHSSAPPSGSRGAGPIWRGTRPASACSGCAGGASAT